MMFDQIVGSFLLALSLLSTILAQDLLPNQFPSLSTEAWVWEAEVTPDGSVFLLGDFSSVDGISRPGLAKLNPNGTLNLDFAPLEVDDLNQLDDLGSMLILGPSEAGTELFALSRGGLMRSNPMRFEIRNPDGSTNDDALRDLRDGLSSVRPQFEKDGKLWLIVRSERQSSRIVIRDSQTLQALPDLPLPADLPEPPFAFSPAGNGKIWVLGRSYYHGALTTGTLSAKRQFLYRLNPNGSLDDSFSPEELNALFRYRIEQSSDDHLVLSRTNPDRFFYWPTPSHNSRIFEFRDENGIIIKKSEVWSISTWRIPADDPESPHLLQNRNRTSGGLVILPDGRFLMDNELYTAAGQRSLGGEALPPQTTVASILPDNTLVLQTITDGGERFSLWHPDTGTIPGLENTRLTQIPLWDPHFQKAARGKFFISQSSWSFGPQSPFTTNSLFSQKILRLHANGSLDPTFELIADSGTFFHQILPVSPPNSPPTLWIAGRFSQFKELPRDGLAIVADRQASGFQEWMRACAGISPELPITYAENGDEDGDGLDNFFEYAAGTHPTQHRSLAEGIRQIGHLTWQVTCNPEAPEIIRRLEVSENLTDWQAPQANELRLETDLGCFSWTLQPRTKPLFSRLKLTR